MLHLANVTPSGVTSPYIIYYNIEHDARVVFDPFFGKASWRRQHASRRISKANFSRQAISWIEIVSRLNQVISGKLINLIEIISKFAQTSNTPKFDWSCSHNSSYKVFVFFSPKEVSENYPDYLLKIDVLPVVQAFCTILCLDYGYLRQNWVKNILSQVLCELFMNIFWNMLLKFQHFL